MKYIKLFKEGINSEYINLDEISKPYSDYFGYMYNKDINGNKVFIHIDNEHTFGYSVNGSHDIDDNNTIDFKTKIKILNFVKNVLFAHIEKYQPNKIYFSGSDFNDKLRMKKDDLYKNFLSKANLPKGYSYGTEFTDYGTKNVIKRNKLA